MRKGALCLNAHPQHQKLQEVSRSHPPVVACGQALEEARTAASLYQYFALHHCERKLSWIRYEILRQWKHALQRRGQRRRLSWERLSNCSWFELPFARNMHPAV
jgi:hypothetical protein